MPAGTRRCPRPLLIALLLTLCALFVFLPGAVAADGSFLYGRYAFSQPTRVDLSQFAAGRRQYVFPRELGGGESSLAYYLQPRRVLILMPGSPTIAIELYADRSLDDLVEEQLANLRGLMSDANKSKNRLAEHEGRMVGLGATFNRQASALSAMPPLPQDADVAPLRDAYQQLAQTLHEFILATRELSFYEVQLNREELNVEAARLSLAVLLNQSASGRDFSLLTVREPEELVKQTQARLRTRRQQRESELDAVNRSLTALSAKRGDLLGAAFAFTQPVEPEVLVSTLARNARGFQPAAFSHPREFVAFARNEYELAEVTRKQKITNATLVDVATMETLVSRQAAAVTRLPSVSVNVQTLRVPASMEGITRRLARDSSGWSQAQWASFLSGLARSFAGEGLTRVPVPPRGGAFSGPDYMNLAQLEVPALLAALEGLGGGSTSSNPTNPPNPPPSSGAIVTWDVLLKVGEDGLAAARASSASSSTASASARATSAAELTFWEVCVFLAREGGRGETSSS